MPTEVKWSWSLAGALAAGMSLTAQEAATAPGIAPEQLAMAARIDALARRLAQSPAAASGNLCFSPLVVATTLAYLLLKQQDAVGLMTFDERVAATLGISEEARDQDAVLLILPPPGSLQ